mgnify:CR=1 FL=1|tara:strand:+ start:15550 stop:15786 length:237 start_codon:yes stop_codon:yes gene_type:complete
MNPEIKEVIEHLEMLRDDGDVSSKLKEKTKQVISILNSDQQLAVDKALLELEEVSSANLPSYHRTQIWDIVSMLESAK